MSQAPPPYPAMPPKKGLPPAAWVGIGCGSMILIIVLISGITALTVGRSAMKKFKDHPALPMVDAVLSAHPEVARLAEDKQAGSVTLAPPAKAAEVKASYEEIVHGKVTAPDRTGIRVPLFQGDLTKVPAWVPRYPAATGVVSLAHQDLPDKIHGILVMETTDSAADVEKFFNTEAGKLFSASATSSNSFDFNGVRRAKFSYAGGKRKIEILAYGKSGSPLTVMTIYTEEK